MQIAPVSLQFYVLWLFKKSPINASYYQNRRITKRSNGPKTLVGCLFDYVRCMEEMKARWNLVKLGIQDPW